MGIAAICLRRVPAPLEIRFTTDDSRPTAAVTTSLAFTARVGENIAGCVRQVRLVRAGRKLRMGAVDITE